MTSAAWLAFRQAAPLYGAVALGAMLGGLGRWLVSLALLTTDPAAFPWATLCANLAGSFVIGFYATLSGPDGRLFAGPRQRQFVMAGLCGGFTTFSVFSLESLRLLQAGGPMSAGLYIAVSLVGWLMAVWLGHLLARRLNRLEGA